MDKILDQYNKGSRGSYREEESANSTETKQQDAMVRRTS